MSTRFFWELYFFCKDGQKVAICTKWIDAIWIKSRFIKNGLLNSTGNNSVILFAMCFALGKSKWQDAKASETSNIINHSLWKKTNKTVREKTGRKVAYTCTLVNLQSEITNK